MIAHHADLHRVFLRAHNRLHDRRDKLWIKALAHLGVAWEAPDAGLNAQSTAAEIAGATASLERQLLSARALGHLFLGAGWILTRRDGSFDFARGEGGEGALLLFVAQRGGDLIVGSAIDDFVNQAARTAQSDRFPGPLFLGDADWLLDLETHEFIDCLAWPIAAPERVYRRNCLVDALWQGGPGDDGALDLYTTPRAWLAAWLEATCTMADYRACATLGLPVGGHGPGCRASLVLDPGAIDWTRHGGGPLGLDGARTARIHDSAALATRIDEAQRRVPAVNYPPPATILVPQATGVAA